MKKALIALAVLCAAWFGLKDIALQSYLSNGELNVPASLSYDTGEAWAVTPEVPPPGAWETPWGVDAFVVLPPANVNLQHGLLPIEDAEVIKDTLGALQQMGEAIPGQTPVYAPLYRAPSPATKGDDRLAMNAMSSDDLLSAFEHYLETFNNGRGIMLIIAESSDPYASPLIERLQEDDLVSRFAGLISFGPETSPYETQPLKCANVLGDGCHQKVTTKSKTNFGRLLMPSLSYTAPALNVIDANGVAQAIKTQAENVSIWLDETQPKPAEPFFATEIIESSPIYRPGEDAPIEQSDEN